MAFNPLKEKGTPIEQQIKDWTQLNTQPYNKSTVNPFTRARGILMNGIEVEATIFKHQFTRHTEDIELKRQIALSRRIEQQHQKMVNWCIPGNESTLEVTIGYEQLAVDLTASMARVEPAQNVKAALDFALIEDFDHLYRYANLMEMLEGKKAEKIVGDYTEIMPGRPTIAEHRHPFDSLRQPFDKSRADMLTKMHVLTITAAEQQTMNYYMNVGNRFESELARGLYLEIAQIEEQHVSQYESLADPTMSWFEMLLLHEYNECYMYYSCMTSEGDSRTRSMWQRHLEDEIEHLRIAADLMRRYEKREAETLLPGSFPELTVLQPNKDYVRQIIASQIDLTADDSQLVPVSSLPPDHRYHKFQSAVNRQGAPSQTVIEEHIRKSGRDYRMETEGPHPVERFRTREKAGTR